MAGRCLHSPELQKRDRTFTTVLESAILEWVLIFMLFVYGLFGYLITKFARYCELPLPCLLCSRLDHILGSEKVGFYWDLICGNHKLEISTLVYCHFHEKLVDVRGMCESCLFSFATKNKSNAETYRLLVGKLGGEDLSGFDNDSVINDDDKTKGLDMKHCSCCNELFMSRRHAQTLLQTKSSGFDDTDFDLPLSRESSLDRKDLKMEVKPLDPSADVGKKNENTLVPFGYSELKVTSDTESDVHMSDAEDARPLISNDPLRDLLIDSTPMRSFIAVSEDESACNNDQDVLSPEPSESFNLVPANIIDLHENPSAASASAIGHGLEELDWQDIDINLDSSASTNLMASNNVSESSNDGNVFMRSSIDGSNNVDFRDSKDLDIKEIGIVMEKMDVEDSKNLDTTEVGVVMERVDVKDSKNLETIEVGVLTERVDVKDSKEMDFKEAEAVKLTDKSHDFESSQSTTDHNTMQMESDTKDGGLQIQNHLDLSDAYKVATSGKSRQLSGKVAGKESPSVSSDLKLLLSHLSRGSEFPTSDILSPGLFKKLDELKASDTSTSVGMKILQKRISLERNDSRNSIDRNESGIESLDFSSVSEIEGESEVDRLKRQLEHDRKFLIGVLKELEEEKNASEIAANETMAMITRLQEEKAALQMEASHDLRMMEEQAEYDLEALDKLNEHVMEKEKEIQELEAELEYYRTKYQNESNLENDGESVSNVCLSGSEKTLDNLNGLAENTKRNSKYPLLEIENERKHISECLNNLEKKLSTFCCNRIYPDLKDGDRSEEQGKDSYDPKLPEEGQQVTGEREENGVSSDKVGFVSTGSHQTLLRRVYSFKRSKSAGAEQRAMLLKEADIVAIVNEVSNLSKRLQALEADRSFIEHSITTLQNGEEGLIQEIASHLRELRKIGIRRHDEHNPVKR